MEVKMNSMGSQNEFNGKQHDILHLGSLSRIFCCVLKRDLEEHFDAKESCSLSQKLGYSGLK